MEKLKKFLAFIAIVMIFVGAVCAIGWTFYEKEFVAGICCVVLTAAAVPTEIKLFKYIQE